MTQSAISPVIQSPHNPSMPPKEEADVSFEPRQVYSTDSIYLGAFLLVHGCTLVAFDTFTLPFRFIFSDGTGEATRLADQFAANADVPVREYIAAHRKLQDITVQTRKRIGQKRPSLKPDLFNK